MKNLYVGIGGAGSSVIKKVYDEIMKKECEKGSSVINSKLMMGNNVTSKGAVSRKLAKQLHNDIIKRSHLKRTAIINSEGTITYFADYITKDNCDD